MEPITTAAAISAVVGYLAKTIKDNKTVADFFSDFTSASVNWIKPLFLKEEIKQLEKEPENKERQELVESVLKIASLDNKEVKNELLELAKIIQEKAEKGESVKIVNSKNVNTGNVNTGGGNFTLGDNNNLNPAK